MSGSLYEWHRLKLRTAEKARFVLRSLEDVLWPRGVRCILCAGPASGGPLCRDCEEQLAHWRVSGPVCPKCGRPLEDEGATCADCERHRLLIDRCIVGYRYDGAAGSLIRALKFDRVTEAAEALTAWLPDALVEENARAPFDCVTWVTMPARRRRLRGVDHGKALAGAVAERLGLKLERLLDRADEGNTTQRGMDAAGRATHLKNKFRAVPGVAGKRVLLVDDVLTTGATISECGSVLERAGGKVLAFAMTCAGGAAGKDGGA